MRHLRYLTPVAFAIALGLAVPGFGWAFGTQPPPEQSSDSRQDEPAGQDAAKERRSDWRAGYGVAVSFIRDGRYDDAIRTLVALDKADSPDVQNYIGYANRQLGRMDEARVHYEAALAVDPNHRGALEYYGEWHVELGRLAEARGFLERLALLGGTSCQEYQDLAAALAAKDAR